MLQAALENEVAEYLAEHAHQRDEAGRQAVVRNGSLPERDLVRGVGPVTVKQPRVRDRREGHRFTSKILPAFMRRVPSIDALIPALYLKGVSRTLRAGHQRTRPWVRRTWWSPAVYEAPARYTVRWTTLFDSSSFSMASLLRYAPLQLALSSCDLRIRSLIPPSTMPAIASPQTTGIRSSSPTGRPMMDAMKPQISQGNRI